MCSHRVMIQDKSTGGILMVPCGRCIACRLNKARGWSIRIMHEVKTSKASCFVTLTYSDQHLPADQSLSVEDCQRFFKRLRKNSQLKIRYFLGGEYGEQGNRPHYHAIIFGLSKEFRAEIERSWGLGYVTVNDVTVERALYVAKYTTKKLSGSAAVHYLGRKPEFGLMSRRPGIGHDYLDTNGKFIESNGFCVVKGNKVGLPRYYSERIFKTEEQKNALQKKRQEFINENFEKSRTKAGGQNLHPYQVADYMRSENAQGENDLLARERMKRRKL